MKAIVYLPLKPEIAKMQNLPVKLPVLAEDMPLIVEKDRIPLDVIIRGLEAQVELGKEDRDYYATYLQYFYYEKFKKLLSENKLEEAKEFLEKAKGLGEDYRYHFYKGLLLEKEGREGEAEVELKIASSMNPKFSLAHYELGRIYMKKGEYDDAEAEFQKALEKDPEFALPFVKLGDVYLSKGDLKSASEMYRKALEKSRDLPDVYNRLGVIGNSLQNFKNAEKFFRKALEILPDYPEALFNLSYTLIKLGKIFEALEILSDLEKRFPEDPDILNELGIVMRELGLFEDSVEKLEKAYEISKDDGTKYNLARSMMFVDREKARELLEELSEGEYSFRAKDLLEYLDKENEIQLREAGEIGELALEISSCDDLLCVLKDLDTEGEIGERIEAILEGFVPKGSEMDTVELLELATAYILTGKDFIDMERKATEFAVGVYGSGVMIGAIRVILRAIQMKSDLGDVMVEQLIESVVPELQDLHWNLALKVSRSLETVPVSYPSSGSEFVASLMYYLKFSKDVPEVYRPWIDLLAS
jgi:Tfp pilus assembly protein PilF